MKRALFLLSVSLFSLLGSNVKAQTNHYDFAAANEYGDTIYYNITSDSTVEVTYNQYEFYDGSVLHYINRYNDYLNPIIIPSLVFHNSNAYFVSAIGILAFFECHNIVSIILPNTIVIIQPLSFMSCSRLTSFTIPNSVTEIGSNAFAACSSLQFISIANSVNVIGVAAFGSIDSLRLISLPESIIKMKASVFSGCTNLKEVSFNSINCDTMGSYTTIRYQGGSYVKYESVFENTPALQKITIGSNVQSIPDKAFYGCNNLDTIVSKAIVPPQIHENTFYGVPTDIPLIVPCNDSVIYEAAAFWNNFSNIQENCVGLDEVVTENNISIYPNPAKDILNIKVDKLNKGYLFVYDVMGKEVLSRQITKDELSIDVSSLVSGVYMIKFVGKDNKIIGSSEFVKH